MLSRIGRDIPLPLPVPDWSKPIILLLLLMVAGFAGRARMTARRVKRLEAHEARLEDDLAAMQVALVPEIPARVGELDVSVAYRPADGLAAGGDFYDAFALDSSRVAVILGDVSGHGRAALAHANHMRHTLRAYVEAGLNPRGALRLAGRVLAPSDDDLFCTVAIAVYDADAGTLTYATAGHPAPLIQGTRHDQAAAGCASPALGWGAPTGRRQTTIPFPRGASACFFSDGLTEARDEDGLLGRDRLEELLCELGEAPSADGLIGKVRDRAPMVQDDMAACVVQARSGRSLLAATLEELELERDELDTHAPRFLTACRVPPSVIPAIMERARAIAGQHGGAVLAVEIAGSGPTAALSTSVSAPGGAVPVEAISRKGTPGDAGSPAEPESGLSVFPGPGRRVPSHA